MAPAREIRLPAPHPRFRARSSGSGRAPTHPGTAVRIGDDLYEVMSSSGGSGEWVYRLEPWDAGNVTRVCVDWGEAEEREFLAGLRTERVLERRKVLARGTQALWGFLPAKLQERLAADLGYDPGRASLWSALIETLLALPPAFLFVLSILGAGGRFGPVIPAWAGWPALAALAEGVIRLVITVSSGEPVGCLALAILGLRLRAEPAADVMADEYAAAGDSLIVRAPTAKAWWERAGGVTYRGEPYALVGVSASGPTRVYRFRKGGDGFPEADPARERARNITSDRVYALAPLWGFLPSRFQEALEFYGRYRPRLYVGFSIAFTVLLSVSFLAADAGRISRGVFGWGSAARLLFAALLLAESVLRLARHLQRAEVPGSFLGALVKPFYYLAVRSGPGEVDGRAAPPKGPEGSTR